MLPLKRVGLFCRKTHPDLYHISIWFLAEIDCSKNLPQKYLAEGYHEVTIPEQLCACSAYSRLKDPAKTLSRRHSTHTCAMFSFECPALVQEGGPKLKSLEPLQKAGPGCAYNLSIIGYRKAYSGNLLAASLAKTVNFWFSERPPSKGERQREQ